MHQGLLNKSNVVAASSDAEIYPVIQGDTKNNRHALPKK
jgi:hypothetical protein